MPIERNPAALITERERAAVDRALASLGVEPQRSDLLPLLHALQAELGWLPRGALHQLADRMNLAFPDVWGVVTFYAMFRLDPPPGVAVHVCDDVPCRLRGADSLVQRLEARYGPPRRFTGEAHGAPPHEALPAGPVPPVDWETVSCLGRCEDAPVAVVDGCVHRRVTLEAIVAAAAPGTADA